MKLALVLAVIGGCATVDDGAGLPLGPDGTRLWREARADLGAIRARFDPAEPYSMNVALDLTQPQIGKRMRARGAVAVRPPNALRMILLGPGGTTALDLWICDDRFRFAVPAIDLERRGDATTPAEELRGLPVAFLRWWFLRPFGGRLLSFDEIQSDDASAGGRRFVMRDGAQIIHLIAPNDRGGDLFRASRISLHDRETLEVRGGGCGEVRYQQRSTGIDIDVRCEKVNEAAPPDRAFVDPDDSDAPCGGLP